jgi:hypothetical protein
MNDAQPEHGETLTLGPQCGPHVAVDEDGCCASCGATATGDGATRVLKALAIMRKEMAEIAILVDRITQIAVAKASGVVTEIAPDARVVIQAGAEAGFGSVSVAAWHGAHVGQRVEVRVSLVDDESGKEPT